MASKTYEGGKRAWVESRKTPNHHWALGCKEKNDCFSISGYS